MKKFYVDYGEFWNIKISIVSAIIHYSFILADYAMRIVKL